jgi:superfamily II DNA or RNA helicase
MSSRSGVSGKAIGRRKGLQERSRRRPPEVEDVVVTKVRRRKKSRAQKSLSRLRKPDDMTVDQWQVALRREFGRQQKFRLKNVGSEPLFSEFEVTNPQTKRTYRVAIRGQALGENFCSCPDFAVNALGTCKHVEFALAKLGRGREAKMALALGHQPEYSEVYLQYGAQREVVFHAGTDCPPALKKLARQFFDDNDRLPAAAFARFHLFLQKAQSLGHDFRCYNDALEFIAEVRDRELTRERVEKAFPNGVRSAAFKNLLKVKLYPYQREGALFAAKAGRCLIADDMGLGKTIQAIAAVEILAREAGVERVLIVAPTSLKHQWQQEIEKFSGRQALVVEGLLPRRTGLYSAESFYKITNYDVICRDLEAIARWQPDVVILDEAQRIKNWKTRTAQAVKRLQSKYAIVLTGTPLENRLEELHSIVEFVDRFRLGPMFRFLAEHQHVDDNGKVVGYRNLSRISESIGPILVRRTKDKVLKELPERLEKRFFVPMTEPQMAMHEENREIVARLVQKWRKYGFLNEADQLRMRIALQNMRMSCNSTYLLDKQTDHGVKADELAELLGEILEEEHAKVVIFSQWLRMHELVVRRLERRRWQHVLFHGGVPGPHRKDLVRRFKEDADCRLFLSTDAGGVGLNLQHASAVVNLDQPWNPAVLEQRIGRVHRLGQQRPVRVVHFIAQGTIEEGMLNLLAFKRSVFAGVLDAGDDEVFMGGTRLKRFMESVDKATGSIPQPMPAAEEGTRSSESARGEAAEETLEAAEAAADSLEDSAVGEPSSHRGPSGIVTPSSVVAPPDQLWTDVLATGMSLLEKLGQAMGGMSASGGMASRGAAAGGHALPGGPLAALVARDDPAGQPYLRLPLPSADVVQKIADVLAMFGGKR